METVHIGLCTYHCCFFLKEISKVAMQVDPLKKKNWQKTHFWTFQGKIFFCWSFWYFCQVVTRSWCRAWFSQFAEARRKLFANLLVMIVTDKLTTNGDCSFDAAFGGDGSFDPLAAACGGDRSFDQLFVFKYNSGNNIFIYWSWQVICTLLLDHGVTEPKYRWCIICWPFAAAG